MNKAMANPWFGDVKAGFTVFLIALPLSIGIASASGVPAAAGLIAASIGGLLGSWLGGAAVTINGPAAGLIVVTSASVAALDKVSPGHGYQLALAVFLVAGLLQIVLGRLRVAGLVLSFPPSVVHGMLTAIGAIIAAKQIHVALGVTPAATKPLDLMREIPHSLFHMNPEIAFIALVSLTIVGIYQLKHLRFLKFIPMPLMIVMVGLGLSRYFGLDHDHMVNLFGSVYTVKSSYLLSLPENIIRSLTLPDFSRFFTLESLSALVSVTLIASLESTLSAFAVDRLDPERRRSDLNKDLMSKGVCNAFSASLGGIPMIAEIVRSSANVSHGARTWRANFFHGLFVLLFLILFPHVLRQIPLASLAVVLTVVGWRLAHPRQFFHAYHIGADHFASFVATFIVTLATDLLVGVAAGLLVEFIILAWGGVKPRELLRSRWHDSAADGKVSIVVSGPLVFSNFALLRQNLLAATAQGKAQTDIHVDCSESSYIDHTVRDFLEFFKTDCTLKGIPCVVQFSPDHVSRSNHPLATRRRVEE